MYYFIAWKTNIWEIDKLLSFISFHMLCANVVSTKQEVWDDDISSNSCCGIYSLLYHFISFLILFFSLMRLHECGYFIIYFLWSNRFCVLYSTISTIEDRVHSAIDILETTRSFYFPFIVSYLRFGLDYVASICIVLGWDSNTLLWYVND